MTDDATRALPSSDPEPPSSAAIAEMYRAHLEMEERIMYGSGGKPDDTPLFPDAMGDFLRAVLAPLPSDGPPYVHDLTPRPCAPCSDRYETGQCGCDCHRPKPSFTIERVPLGDEPEPTPRLSRRDRDRFARQIARLYAVPLWIAGIGSPPSRVANAAYRQRQRNRVKRRRG